MTRTHLLLVSSLLTACSTEDYSVLRANHLTGNGDGSGRVGVSLDDDQQARSWEDLTVEVQVDTRSSSGGGDWEPASNVSWSVDELPAQHVAVVADNSMSLEPDIEDITSALSSFSNEMYTAGNAEMGLVRVSTEARVYSMLTQDPVAFSGAASELFVSNGWTALYDGVRMANEILTLGDKMDGESTDACLNKASNSIVVFTDGQENNSNDEHASDDYPGDGVATSLEDLLDLTIHGGDTAIHTVAVGDQVHVDDLQLMADETGGTYREIADWSALDAGLVATSMDMGNEVPVCFDVAECDHDEARITVSVTDESGTMDFVTVVDLPESVCGDRGSDDPELGCTRDSTYWGGTSDWPTSSLELGDAMYPYVELECLMQHPIKDDASVMLAKELIAAKLNVASGADDSEIADVVDAADAWLASVGGRLPLGMSAKDAVEGLIYATLLESWNSGVTGPGHCE